MGKIKLIYRKEQNILTNDINLLTKIKKVLSIVYKTTKNIHYFVLKLIKRHKNGLRENR